MSSKITVWLLLWNIFLINSQDILLTNNDVSLRITLNPGQILLDLTRGTRTVLKGQIGAKNNEAITSCVGVENCYIIGDSRLHINTHIDYGFTVFWTTKNTSKVFEDCFDLEPYHWYGGPERFEQKWPIEKLNLTNFANVLQEDQWGAIVEPYWLNSAGSYIFVNDKVPLFINQNTPTSIQKVCFSAKLSYPYLSSRKRVILHYSIVARDNAREAHLHAVKNFLGKPTGHPNFKIISRPIWSTWARYKRDVNDGVLLKFAQEIADHGYSNGQFEIDDDWEECYGALTFRSSKFKNINETVAFIKTFNFTVSLWVHPFININCEKYVDMARKYEYLVKNLTGSDLTQWWNSGKNEATYLDFTNIEVQEWFVERLKNLQKLHGIDSFKFDAGETTWAPTISLLYGDIETKPNILSADYVRTCAKLGDLVEVRAGWKTQDLPIFVRMIDKDSNWGSSNGLYTLITTLLQMNMNGYSMVLPDMVGGNGYYGMPSAELFVRWLQANVFMPSIQFSYVPWDYNNATFNVSEISREFVDLHEKYAPYIRTQMERSIENGDPVNAPIWWICPDDPTAHAIDTEFMLGEDILVAPVITEGATTRDVYLPNGTWKDGNTGVTYQGPINITNYSAPMHVLPYFIRNSSTTQTNSGNVVIPTLIGYLIILKITVVFII